MTVSSETLFGLCAAALVGVGLFGVICQPGALRKLISFNLLGSGVFLLFGVIAKRGGGALAATGQGTDGDPVPQALVITGLVVAFAATAIAIALLRRLVGLSDQGRSEGEPPSSRSRADGRA